MRSCLVVTDNGGDFADIGLLSMSSRTTSGVQSPTDCSIWRALGLALDLRESEGGDEVMAREEFYEECENFGTVVVVQADVEAESVERG